MAKIMFSGIAVTDARGKIGNQIFFRNEFGACVRDYKYPANTITPARTAVRAVWYSLFGLWQTLTADEVHLWNSYAYSIVKKNSVGNSFKLTGRQLFMQRNMNIVTAGFSPVIIPDIASVSVPVCAVTPIAFSTISLQVDFQSVNFSGTVSADNAVVIYASPMLSAGIFSPPRVFRIIDVLDEGTSLIGNDFILAYNAVFPSPIAATKIFFRAAQISKLNGFKSVFSQNGLVVS